MDEKQKEDMLRFNPDCPKCKRKMEETITGRYKCDHCRVEKDRGLSLADIKYCIEKLKSAPMVSVDVETTSANKPNKNGDVFPSPFLPHDFEERPESDYKREVLGQWVDEAAYKDAEIAKMSRTDLRQAVIKLGTLPVKEVARMPSKMLQDILLAEKMGQSYSPPRLFIKDKKRKLFNCAAHPVAEGLRLYCFVEGEKKPVYGMTLPFEEISRGDIREHVKFLAEHLPVLFSSHVSDMLGLLSAACSRAGYGMVSDVIDSVAEELHRERTRAKNTIGRRPEFSKKERLRSMAKTIRFSDDDGPFRMGRQRSMQQVYEMMYGKDAYPGVSMGAKVEEPECLFCAAGHEAKPYEIKPPTPGDLVPGRARSKVPLDRMVVDYYSVFGELEVRCHTVREAPGCTAFLLRHPAMNFNNSYEREMFFEELLKHTDKTFGCDRATVYHKLSEAFLEARPRCDMWEVLHREAIERRDIELCRQENHGARKYKLSRLYKPIDKFHIGIDWANDCADAAAYAMMHTHDHISMIKSVPQDNKRLHDEVKKMVDRLLMREMGFNEDELQQAELEEKTKMFKPKHCKKCGHDRGCMHPREEEEPKKPNCSHPFLIRVRPAIYNEMMEAQKKVVQKAHESDVIYVCRDCHMVKVFCGRYYEK